MRHDIVGGGYTHTYLTISAAKITRATLHTHRACIGPAW